MFDVDCVIRWRSSRDHSHRMGSISRSPSSNAPE